MTTLLALFIEKGQERASGNDPHSFLDERGTGTQAVTNHQAFYEGKDQGREISDNPSQKLGQGEG